MLSIWYFYFTNPSFPLPSIPMLFNWISRFCSHSVFVYCFRAAPAAALQLLAFVRLLEKFDPITIGTVQYKKKEQNRQAVINLTATDIRAFTSGKWTLRDLLFKVVSSSFHMFSVIVTLNLVFFSPGTPHRTKCLLRTAGAHLMKLLCFFLDFSKTDITLSVLSRFCNFFLS